MTTYRHMLPEPVPAGTGIRVLSDAEGRIVGVEWEVPDVGHVEIRRRDPAEARARMLAAGVPADIADEMLAAAAPGSAPAGS